MEEEHRRILDEALLGKAVRGALAELSKQVDLQPTRKSTRRDSYAKNATGVYYSSGAGITKDRT